MKKYTTTPISGTTEFLPSTQAVFDDLKRTITATYRRHGFLTIETPILERQEILLAKAGGDTEKQIYKVFKTSEDPAKSSEALRFDHTVPLARYVVEHEQQLSFPLKSAQIGQNFRGERAQKGRFREFYQCDVDVIGRATLPLFYDYDVISTLLDAYGSLGLKSPVLARINNRKIITGLLEALGLSDKSRDIFSIIDHSEKVPREKTEQAFQEIGLSPADTAKMLALINLHGPRDKVICNLKNLGLNNPTLDEGLSELDQTLSLLEQDGYADRIEADLRIVRGLDYYTGLVFEFVIEDHKDIGSVGGGGRYDNLATHFTEQKFPGVGGSIGLSRLFYLLTEHDLLDTEQQRPLDIAILPLSDAELPYAIEVARTLRTQGSTTTILPSAKSLGARLDSAAKIAKSAIILGETEATSHTYEIKPLA